LGSQLPVTTQYCCAPGGINSSGAERQNYSALTWRNTKTIDIFNSEDGEMLASPRRIFGALSQKMFWQLLWVLDSTEGCTNIMKISIFLTPQQFIQ